MDKQLGRLALYWGERTKRKGAFNPFTCARTHTYLHAHTYARTHTQVHNARKHVRTQPYTHARTYTTHAHTHIRERTQTNTHVSERMHTCACTHTYVRTHTHTHMHTHTHARTSTQCMHACMYTTVVYTHTHIRYAHAHTHTRTFTHKHARMRTHAHMRTHAYVRAHMCVHTPVGAAYKARRPSHRLTLCLIIMCAPLALIALGFFNWGFSNLGLVTVQYGIFRSIFTLGTAPAAIAACLALLCCSRKACRSRSISAGVILAGLAGSTAIHVGLASSEGQASGIKATSVLWRQSAVSQICKLA